MAEEKEVKDKKKKCAQTGKTLKRVRRYFRDGQYFVNKAAFKAWNVKQQEEKAKVAEEKKAANTKAQAEAAAQPAAPAPEQKAS